MKKETIDMAIDDYINFEVERRLKAKVKNNVIGKFIRLEHILPVFSDVFNSTGNGIKKYLEDTGHIKMDYKKKRYVVADGSKLVKMIDGQIYIKQNLAQFISRFKDMILMIETNKTNIFINNFKKDRETFLIQAYNMSTAKGKRTLEEFTDIRLLLGKKL